MPATVKPAKAIFLDVIHNVPIDQWASYVPKACGDDAVVLRQVERLLKAHLSEKALATEAIQSVAAQVASPPSEQLGTQIGPYRLLELIGEGGMGLVYMAEQQRPVRRLVALKLVKPGMDSKQVIARFEAERQALALMDHPHIAKVLDAGTVGESKDEGGRMRDESRSVGSAVSSFSPHPSSFASARPFFVMELVRGLPINEFCDQKRLTVRERLQLFVQVCQAVQHAHQKGVIHRDLKPTNVLVTLHDSLSVPKVIDFGIAKALGQSLTEHTLHTGFAQLVGTPLYMSPEQAEMNQLGVDTRSDVYSLGVLLYELLTGTTPFDKESLTKAGLDEMRRLIREEEPPRPSTRVSTLKAADLSTVSSRRSIDPRRISLALRGELDWIVMKALEKDRADRYESASALARDIERFLSDEPVQACPHTAAYRFRKFAKKHRAVLTTALLVAASLLIGIVLSTWQAVRATTAEAEANVQRNQAQQQRDDVQKQRDEVKAVNETLHATQAELRDTLYAAHMHLARNAWETKNIARMQYFLDQYIPKPRETDIRGFEWHYFQRLLHPELLTIRGHSAPIQHVAYSPDGKRLASAAQGQEVKVWDSQTGRELLSLNSGSDDPTSYPDGQRVGDGIDRARKRVEAAAFSTDGKRLASGRKVWNADTGKELIAIQSQGWIRAFSPDGKRLAGTGFRGGPGNWAAHVIVWDAQSGAELLSLKGHIVTLKGHTDHIDGVAYSPDGKRIASACHDQTVKVWDAETGAELLTYRGHNVGVQSVAFSPDGQRLASGSWGNTVHVWEVATGKLLHELAATHRIDEVAFSPDGQRLASASQDGLIRVWDARTGAPLLVLEGHHKVRSVTFSPDGERLASASAELRVWDANHIRRADMILKGGADPVFGIAFSPDGQRLASGTAKVDNDNIYQGGDVKIWDARTTPGVESGKNLLVISGHTFGVWSVAYSPDGKRLATGSHDKTIKIWDAETGQELRTLSGHTGLVRTVIFSADGKHLASATDDEQIKLWDLESGDARTLPGTRTSGMWMATKALAFSPDGRRLAGGSGETLKVWDVASGQVLATIQDADPRFLLGLAFSPDGRYLARSANASVKIWHTQTEQDLRELRGHNDAVYGLAYSPDGKRLASGSLDRTVKIWNPLSGQELLSLDHALRVCHVAFSPDGHRLATNGQELNARIYDATPPTTNE